MQTHSKNSWKALVVSSHSTFYTFGKYDGVSIAEAANDESIMSTLLSIESEGNARYCNS